MVKYAKGEKMRCQERENPMLAVVLLLSLMGIALGVVVLVADGEWGKAMSVVILLGCLLIFFRQNR